MKTRHTTVDYTRSHMSAPRGRGSWAFEIILAAKLGSSVLEQCWFAPSNLTLTEARKAAVAYAVEQAAIQYPEVELVCVHTDALA